MFELILGMLGQLFVSKVLEHTADNALNNAKNIKDFKPILKNLQKNLKSLSAKAADVEEEINNAELSGRKKRKREVEEWLEEVKSFENKVDKMGSQTESEGFIMRLMNGGKAAKLIDEIDKLVEQSRNFGGLVLDVCGTKGETFLTNGLIGELFNENLETVLKLLESRQVPSIGVYGMGGVGKTTLAKHIHNRLLQQSQGRVIWVTVSQEFTLKSIQDKIARCLGVDLLDEDDEDLRAARLHRALSQMKNSVLILDDVWKTIDMLKVGCHVSLDCCRLLITTRSLEVCRQIHCRKVILVEKLHEHEAWKLFNETLGNEIELSSKVEEIARSVAKLCGGLPLGIITIAGSMRSKTTIRAWRNAFIELKERVAGKDGMGEDDVFKVLKYSFDQLKRNHQSQSNEFNTFQLCFLYCSLYPEDYQIHKDDLVRKFISEGMVEQRKSRRAQIEQGHSILEKLVNVCLLENYVGYECVKMHDLVRGMALKIVEGKYMVRAGDKSLMEIPDNEEWAEGLEKVSLMKSGIRRIRDEISPNCSNLSTLLLWGSPLEFIPYSFFSKTKGLRTLDLCGTEIRKLPESICDMKSLKALLLENCHKLEDVPYLGNLKALRELNLSKTAIKEVPQGVEELSNLRFLSMDAPQLKMLPRGLLLKLGHLQHAYFPLDIQVAMEEIENLKQLEEFGGGVKDVNDFNRFITSRVHDTFYSTGVGLLDTCHYRLMRDLDCYHNEFFLFEWNLKADKVLGQDIVYLTIMECEGLSMCFVDDLSQLNNPTSLVRLQVECCGGIEYILRSEQGLLSPMSTLEEILLEDLDDLKGVVKQKGEIGAAAPAQPLFSSLRLLKIGVCNKIKKLGLSVLGAPNLEEISIFRCGEIEEIFEDEGRGSSLTLPKLKQLNLYELPRLKSVCKATMICKSIEIIEIFKCPRLIKKLPVDALPPTKIFVEREWWESLEWENPNLPQLLHPFLHFQRWT